MAGAPRVEGGEASARRPRTQAEYDLPLHVKNVPRLNMKRARLLVRSKAIARLIDPTLLCTVPRSQTLLEADITEADLTKMLKHD